LGYKILNLDKDKLFLLMRQE